MTSGHHPPDLRAWLDANPTDPELRLPRATVQTLADELGRLRQSADRLRKQNKKLRNRFLKWRARVSTEAGVTVPEDALDRDDS